MLINTHLYMNTYIHTCTDLCVDISGYNFVLMDF